MDELENYKKETRPWGSFELFTLNTFSTVKILTVKPGQAFSLQTHEGRAEFWKVLSGTGIIIVGNETHKAEPGQMFFVERGVPHRAEAQNETLLILEISLGNFEESDIVRLDDNYGRP